MERNRKAIFYEELFFTIILAVYLIGVQLFFVSLISVDIMEQLAIHIMIVVITVGTFAMAFSFPVIIRYLPAVPVTAIALLVLYRGAGIWYGFLELINYWILRWNAYHEDGRNLLSVPSVDTTDMVVAILAVSLLFWLFVLLAKEKIVPFAAVWITTIILLASLVSGQLPWMSISLLLTGNMGFTFAMRKQGLVKIKVVWLVIVAVSFLSLCLFPAKNLTVTKSFRQAAKQTVEDARFGKSTLPEGNLYKAHEMNQSSDKMLQVQTDEVKTLYLRGFESGCYQNGTWVEMKKEAYGYEYSGMLQWLKKRKFSPSSQYVEYGRNAQQKSQPNNVTIKNIGADRQYIYAPYATSRIRNARYRETRDNGFRSVSFRGAAQYRLTEMSGNLPGELMVAESWIKSPSTKKQKAYMKSEAAYRSFVYDTYCKVDSSLASLISARFYDNAKSKDMTGAYAITSHIREKLRKMATYKEEPKAVPENEDAIYWFLTQGQEGNSALFASTAVQAFRTFGIPARYAEGYLLTKERINKEKGKAVTLTAKDSHAWVEIYLDGLGWVDIDVTPGFYYEEYALMQMVQKPQGIQMTADLQERSTGNDNDTSAGRKLPEKPVKSTVRHLMLALGIVVLLLIIGVLVVVALEGRRAWKYVRWCRRLRRADRREKSRILYDKIFEEIAALGIEAGIGWQTDKVEEQLREVVPTIGKGEFIVVNQMLEKGIYSEASLSDGEVRALVEFVDKLTMDVKGRKGILNYFKARYV